jgi:hypothetical protein
MRADAKPIISLVFLNERLFRGPICLALYLCRFVLICGFLFIIPESL